MLALTSIWTTILLAAAVALGPLATDMYLPALPQIGSDFGSGTSQVQLTLSLYLVGFAIAQLVCGPLADRFGRKPIMIGGFVLFAIASIGCALASNIETLILCRFLQALGGSAGPVLGRAAIRDIYTPREAAKIMALLASIMALAPAVAPTLGGLMVAGFGWHSIFLALGGYALIMAVVVAFGIPEPMRPEYRQPLKLCSLLRNYRAIGTDISFLGYTLTNALLFSGLFAFLSGSSFVLIDFLEVPPQKFGLYFAGIVVGYVAGNLAAIHLGSRLVPDQILVRGLVIAVAAGSLMMALALAEVFSVWAVILPQALFMAGTGMVMPQTMAGAMANFPRMAGSASALFGFAQMAIAACAGMLVGHLHDGTSLVMATIIAICAACALASYLLLVQRHPAPGFEPQAVSGQ
ncbi:MFS transporter, DHA1 family, bicyclomycin/chloramphenicol resistance protein [Marinobacter sp. LV10R510-11A]|uniref:Bcr/CflA family multidrug efflux MFS transporter n=1 Tax=Marinobacter sp. LV10R510-11A TaxID=1415568 RepID=UPI000BB89AE9|nr:Bcr/CflA family multidrug efflux MFS transporter [Marinobacter sp. LV10R510-11A]SOB77529.1 MFS transporter, DHA1 family, bicyclomycin/chloramphenicol resistance protein [Marinobacter sp. LV10R510-11A]